MSDLNFIMIGFLERHLNMYLVCNRNTILSAGCPTVVTIVPEQGPYDSGDVLTCRADGYVKTYEWKNVLSGNAVISTASEVTLVLEGPFSYTCTIEIEEFDCFATDDISGIGKY